MKTFRIAISGYYGFNNAGDEAVLAGIVKSLKSEAQKRDIPIEIDVLSINPEETHAIHDVLSSHRYRVKPLLDSITKCDLLLSGGGSLFQDVTSAHGIFYYYFVVRAAQFLGKKTMFIAQGIGPLHLPRSQKLVADIAGNANAVTVRDNDSKDLLISIGANNPNIEVTADPALLLPDLKIPSPQNDRTIRIGVSLRPWQADISQVINHIVEGLRILSAPIEIVPIVMQPEADRPVMDQLIGACKELNHNVLPIDNVPVVSHLNTVIDAISSCDIVIGMRLHALIIAAGAGIPSLAISYDPKVDSFMAESAQKEYVCPIESSQNIPILLGALWNEREKQEQQVYQRSKELRLKAMKNAETAIGLLSSSK